MKCPNCHKSLWFVRSFCPFCKTNINAPPRPKAVTVVSWFFIVISCTILLQQLVNAEFRAEFLRPGARTPWQLLFVLALPMVYLVLGGCTLVGHNWARWVLVVWLGVNAVSAIAVGADLKALCVGLLMFIATAYYLFRPQARAFFQDQGTVVANPGAEAES